MMNLDELSSVAGVPRIAQAMFDGLSANTVAGIYMVDETLRFTNCTPPVGSGEGGSVL